MHTSSVCKLRDFSASVWSVYSCVDEIIQPVLTMATADGSWDLTVIITDMNVEQTIRTRGDLHVAGLMLRLVNAVGKSN